MIQLSGATSDYYKDPMDRLPDYTLLDHTADLGVKIKGSDMIDLFENAGRTLLHLMLSVRGPNTSDSIKVSLSGLDPADLMVRWLSEILYLFEGENLVVNAVHVDSLRPEGLEATLGVSPFDPKRHRILREIKAVTYHQIEVSEKNGVWYTTVIFDL